LRIEVFVTPKRSVLDPQGRAVELALKSLGFHRAHDVRVGKYIVLEIEAASAAEAREAAEEMCRRLLANTVIEDYRLKVEGE
jgi:phosphoribosylformylglycinamidine synthase PurS subunit